MYLPYFKLKVQELLLFLDMLDLENTKRLNQYVSGHVETIKEILHRLSEIYFRYYLLHIRNCIVINNLIQNCTHNIPECSFVSINILMFLHQVEYQEQVSYTNALSSFAFCKSFNTVPISPKIAIPLSSMNSGKN